VAHPVWRWYTVGTVCNSVGTRALSNISADPAAAACSARTANGAKIYTLLVYKKCNCTRAGATLTIMLCTELDVQINMSYRQQLTVVYGRSEEALRCGGVGGRGCTHKSRFAVIDEVTEKNRFLTAGMENGLKYDSKRQKIRTQKRQIKLYDDSKNIPKTE